MENLRYYTENYNTLINYGKYFVTMPNTMELWVSMKKKTYHYTEKYETLIYYKNKSNV